MNKSPRKIRFLVSGLAPSAPLQHVFNIANWLTEDGWHVEIIAPDYRGMDLPYPLDESVRLTMIATQDEGKRRRRVVYFLFLLWTICRGTDVVVATTWYMAYLALGGRILGPRTRLVQWMYDYEPETHVRSELRQFQWILDRLSRLIYRLPLHRVAVTEALKQQTKTQATILSVSDDDDMRKAHIAYFNGLIQR